MKATIVQPPRDEARHFFTTTKNTDLGHRETLEEALANLAGLAGASVVHKRQNARGTYFYEVQGSGFPSYQSASNTILELTRILTASGRTAGVQS